MCILIILVFVGLLFLASFYPKVSDESGSSGATATRGGTPDVDSPKFTAGRKTPTSVKQYAASSRQALDRLLEQDAADAKQEKKKVEVAERLRKKQEQFEDDLVAQSKTLLKEKWEREIFIDRWRSAYRDYLNSSKWDRVREKILKRAGGLCEYCGAEASEIHHERYPKNFLKFDFSRENYSYLRAVCRKCHTEKHGLG